MKIYVQDLRDGYYKVYMLVTDKHTKDLVSSFTVSPHYGLSLVDVYNVLPSEERLNLVFDSEQISSDSSDDNSKRKDTPRTMQDENEKPDENSTPAEEVPATAVEEEVEEVEVEEESEEDSSEDSSDVEDVTPADEE